MAETKTVAELKQEIADLKSKLEIKTEQDKKINNNISLNEKYLNEPVTIKLFKDNGKYRDDVFVCVNDKS